MKTIRILTMFCMIGLHIVAQPPQKMSYQAVIRDAGGNLVKNHTIGMKVSVLQGSPSGTVVFQELFHPNPQTNDNGLVSVEIGTGIPLTGTFSGIKWESGPYFFKTETDPAGGTDYSVTGISQLLSVPYAMYAKDVQNNDDADANSTNEIQDLSNNNNILSLSKSFNSVDLTKYLDDTDNQNLSITGNNLSISKGNSVILPLSPFTSSAGITSNKPLTDHFVFGSSSMNDLEGSGDDSRMFFNKSNGAFRAGIVDSTEWDTSNRGYCSFATGHQTIASGAVSISMGLSNFSSGHRSFAVGSYNSAVGDASKVMGEYSQATGKYSTSIGAFNTHAKGDNSMALGTKVSALSFAETTMGYLNTNYTPKSTTTWIPEDRLFVIGNGWNYLSDALVILKNGNIGIGTSTPSMVLEVTGSVQTTTEYISSIENTSTGRALNVKTNGGVALRVQSNGSSAHCGWFTNDAESGNALFGNATHTSPGYGVYGKSTYRAIYGNGPSGGTTAWSNWSDARLKENVTTITGALDKVKKLRGITFTWKSDQAYHQPGRNMGFLAQEAINVIPEVVVYDNKEDRYDMMYAPVTALLTEAIKEQQEIIENQQKQIDELKQLVEKLAGTTTPELGQLQGRIKMR